MSLIQNGGRFVGVNRMFSGVTTIYGGGFHALRSNSDKNGCFRNFTSGEHTVSGVTNQTSVPHGQSHPGAWFMPVKAGGMASYNNVTGSGSISVDALAVKLAEASLTGDGSLTAIGGLIVQALADLTGSGEISSANLQAFLAAVAALSGTGSISSSTLTGIGAMLLALSGSGTVTSASSTLTAIGELEAALLVTGTGLSTANVGQAVWAALAASNNTTGTMGEKLNDAGSASNPWTEVIESGLTAAEILKIILAVQAGKTTISGSDVSFRDVDDTKDRVFAEMTGSERTTVTLDGS